MLPLILLSSLIRLLILQVPCNKLAIFSVVGRRATYARDKSVTENLGLVFSITEESELGKGERLKQVTH